jgi:TRAP-type C4-dicarboxylate transport system permease large subunit
MFHLPANLDLVHVAGILVVLLAGLLAGGLWIGISLIICGFAAMLLVSTAPIGPVLATTTWSSGASWSLAALPLFIWMGEILFRTRLSENMFRGLSPWLGWLPGRLVHVNVIGCGIFAAVSGSSAATAATIGKIALPVVYAVAANVSIIQVFLAGFLPGLVVMALYSGYIVAWSLLHPERVPPRDPPMPLIDKLRATTELFPIVALVGLVFCSLIFGWATATECAAWGVMGALILAWWSGTLTWPTFWGSVMGATRLMAMITLILSGAAFMSAAMAYTGIPVALANWVNALGLNSYALIAALTVMYAILGCFIDGISMIVLTTVVVLPMIKQAGFDLVWFGIFLVIMVEMAQITPPVGFNLFVIQTLTGKDSFTVARAALPFFCLLLIATVIITVFPNIALLLPRMAFPAG